MLKRAAKSGNGLNGNLVVKFINLLLGLIFEDTEFDVMGRMLLLRRVLAVFESVLPIQARRDMEDRYSRLLNEKMVERRKHMGYALAIGLMILPGVSFLALL